MTTEEWREVPGYNGKYEVSSLGRVRSWTSQKKGGLLNPTPISGQSYLFVNLYDETGFRCVHKVHQLVAAAFIGPCPEGMQVRHLDGCPTRNVVSNLAYGTPSENARDSVRHGTHASIRKTHCPQGHPYDEENTYWYLGSRRCKECRRARNRVYHRNKQKAEVA